MSYLYLHVYHYMVEGVGVLGLCNTCIWWGRRGFWRLLFWFLPRKLEEVKNRKLVTLHCRQTNDGRSVNINIMLNVYCVTMVTYSGCIY